MKKFLLATILLLSLLPMMADLAFDEPVTLFSFDGLELGSLNAMSPNGNQVVIFRMNYHSIPRTYMQIFTPQDQAVLPEPILVGNKWLEYMRLVVNADNSIAICCPQSGDDGYSSFIIDTYDSLGNPVPALSGIAILGSYSLGLTTPYHFMSDGQGGYHFSFWIYQYSIVYQHIDANGNLSHLPYGLIVGTSDGDYRFKLFQTADHGAIITYPYYESSTHQDRVKLCKIGGDHQISWQINYPGSVPYPSDFSLLTGPDNTFYTVSQSGALVNRLDYAGNSLWNEEWAPTGVQNPKSLSTVSTSNGNLVVQYRTTDPYPLPVTYYQVLVNPSGELVLSSQISTPASSLVADHSGGWYVIKEPPLPSVQYYSSTGQTWPESAVISTYTNILRFSAYIRPECDNLRIIYSANTAQQTYITTQEVDIQANMAYPFPGFNLLTGVQDNAFDLYSATLSNGAIFTMWRQGSTSFLYSHKIMYNVVTPGNQNSLPAPLCFMEQAQYLQRFWLFPVDDGNILICWTRQSGNNYVSHAQLLNPGSGPLWEPEGRLLYSGYGEPSFCFYNNSLYMTRLACLHRFVNGMPMWGSNGILVAQPNPAFAGYAIKLNFVTQNFVIWTQSSNQIYPEMSFLNIFSEDGSLQYPLEGIPLAEISGDYLGAGIAEIFPQESSLIMMIYYYYRVWEYDDGPSSPQSWHYYYGPAFSVLNPDGSLSINPVFIGNGSNVHCMSEGAYYVAPDFGSSHIIKRDLFGNNIWSVSYNSDSYITGLYPLADGRIMIISYDINANLEHTLFYALLSANGQIEYPADAFFAFGDCPAAYGTDFGMFLLINPITGNNGSNYAGVQYYELAPLHNSDPHASPGLISISQNFPNPFMSNTAISVKIPQETRLKLRVFNIRGQFVKTIYNGSLAKGDNILEWDGKDDKGRACASGVYIFRAETSDACRTVKALILK